MQRCPDGEGSTCERVQTPIDLSESENTVKVDNAFQTVDLDGMPDVQDCIVDLSSAFKCVHVFLL